MEVGASHRPTELPKGATGGEGKKNGRSNLPSPTNRCEEGARYIANSGRPFFWGIPARQIARATVAHCNLTWWKWLSVN